MRRRQSNRRKAIPDGKPVADRKRLFQEMNDWWHKIRQKRALCIVLLCSVLAASFLGYYCFQKNKGKFTGDGNEKSALDYRPDYLMRIERLQFYGMKDGRRVISIFGDSFVIEKKKLGFLTLSFAHVARLDNVRIDLYDSGQSSLTGGDAGTAVDKKKDGAEVADTKKGAAAQTAKRTFPIPPALPLSPPTRRPSYDAVLSEEAFQGFPVSIRSISGIVVAPITVRLYNGDIQASQLTASRAELRFKHRDILCEGNVRIVSGRRELKTESLIFQPTQGLFQMKHPYLFSTAGTVKGGSRLTTDVYLRPQKQEHHD